MIKRLFDIVFTGFFGLILAPFVLILACMIRCFMGSPVIFKQQRPGLNANAFYIYKFRTMNNKKNTQGEFEVNNWIISEFIVEKLVPVVGVHPFPLDELSLMTAAVCRFQPELIFEWGTNIGKSARIFSQKNNGSFL